MKENEISTICPNCEKERHAEPIHEQRIFSLNEESIEINVDLLQCLECGEKFEDHNKPIDELDIVYREYRQRHNMFQPEEIKELRESLRLTHDQFAKIIGITKLEAIGYEKGVLQEKRIDSALKIVKKYSVVFSLINPKRINLQKKSILLKEIIEPTTNIFGKAFNFLSKVYRFAMARDLNLHERKIYGR